MARVLRKVPVEVSDDDMRRAFRACKLTVTYDEALKHPTFSIVVRRMAEDLVRKHLRLIELQRRDRKLAQANDYADL